MAAPTLLDKIRVRWRFGAGGRFFLFRALFTVWFVSPTETLEVTIFASPKSVLANEDISLECKFTGYNAADFNLKNVGVQWIGPNRQEIYVFNGGTAIPQRHGAKMSTTELQKGDASLHLQNIQLTEEGQYTCIVYVTPEKVEKTSELEVSARPVVSLSTEHINILIGSEGTLSCDVTGFYPKQHGLIWQKIPNKGSKEPKNLTDICTTATILNNNGTFSVSSIITIVPTLDDDGDVYRCFVTHRSARPDGISQEGTLTVIARPVVRLFSEHINILIGSEGTLSCDVTGFYPKQHELIWQKIPNKGSKEPEELKDNIFMNATIPNNDGTFSVSSRITIIPTLDDDGDVYRCFVTHRSARPDVISQEGTLTVIDPKKYSAVFTILLLVCAIILLLALILVAIYCWHKFRRVPPEIIMSKPPIIRHLEEIIISYQILRFKPRNIAIYSFVKRMEDQTEKKIFEWHSPENRTSSLPKDTTDEVQLLINGNEEDTPFRPLQPVFSDNGDGTFKVQGDIKMYPDVFRDNGAELILQVHHETFAQPAVKSVTLDVRGVPPKVSNIVVPLHTHHNELVALTCSINGFKPRPLTIIWQQMRMNDELKEIVRLDQNNRTIVAPDHGMMRKCNHQINEVEYEDKSYGITSILIIMPDILQDQGTKYICEVQHECTKSVKMKEITLDVTAPPKLDKITCTEKTIAGEPMTLQCRIHSFYPKNIRVTWLKSGVTMTKESEESEPTLGRDGLYYLTSSVKSLPTRADVEKTYTCQVEHESLREPSEVNWVLDRLGVDSEDALYENLGNDEDNFQEVSQITCQTECPKAGQPVTVSCTITGSTVEDTHLTWYREVYPFEDMSCITNTPFKTGVGFTTALTYVPKQEDGNCKLQLDVITEMDPICRYFRLKLS